MRVPSCFLVLVLVLCIHGGLSKNLLKKIVREVKRVDDQVAGVASQATGSKTTTVSPDGKTCTKLELGTPVVDFHSAAFIAQTSSHLTEELQKLGVENPTSFAEKAFRAEKAHRVETKFLIRALDSSAENEAVLAIVGVVAIMEDNGTVNVNASKMIGVVTLKAQDVIHWRKVVKQWGNMHEYKTDEVRNRGLTSEEIQHVINVLQGSIHADARYAQLPSGDDMEEAG